MLLEQTFPQLSFEIDNPKAPGTIYITDDPAINKLTFRIVTNTDGTKFSAGHPVPKADAPTATGSLLYLDLSALKLTSAEFEKLECAANGWDFALYAPALICMTPKKDVTLNSGSGQDIVININKLTLSNPPSSPNISLNVSYFRVPPTTFVNSAPQVSYFSVGLQVAPSGHKDLHSAISCALSTDPYICNTIPGYDPVENDISFALKPGNSPVKVVAGKDTVFTVSFVYASDPTGYGALTTSQYAISPMSINPGQKASAWVITQDTDSENPYWTLVPPNGAPILGAKSQDIVEFKITKIITEFKPGPTLMTVQYRNVPGYDDGSYSLLLTKVPHVSINGLTVSPNPSYLDKDGNSAVHLQWDISDAGTLILYPEVVDVTGKSSYDTTIQKTTTFSLLANGKQLAANGNVATKSIVAKVLPKINSFTANPASTYYKSFPNQVELAWNVASPNKVALVSSVTGRDPNSFYPVGGVGRSITQPQMMTLVPEGLSDPSQLKKLVLSAFKVTAKSFSVPDTPSYELAAMPSGNIVFSTSSGYNSLYAINTLSFESAITPVSVGKSPRGPVISPDGKLIYVANSGDGTVSVLTVTRTGVDGISVSPLTTIEDAGPEPVALAISPLGDQLYVVNTGDDGSNGSLVVFSKSSDNEFTKAAIVELEKGPGHAAVSPDGLNIIISNNASDTLSVIMRGSDNEFSLLATIKTGKSPMGVSVSPDGRYAFVCNSGDGTVNVIAIHSLTVEGIPLATGKHPAYVVVTPSSDYVFVSNSGDASVTLIGYNTTKAEYEVLEKSISVAKGAAGMTISPSGNQVFVASGSGNDISSLSLVSYFQDQSFTPPAMKPTSAAASADGAKVLVWHNPKIMFGGKTQGALAIDTGNYKSIQTFVGLDIYDLAYSPDNKWIYLIQGKDGLISVHKKDAASYTDKGTVTGLSGNADKLFVSADGSLLFISLIGVNKTGNGVAIVQTSDLSVLSTVVLPSGTFASFLPLVATPDMQQVFVAQNDTVYVIKKGSSGYELQSKTVSVGKMSNALSILPDGSKVVTVSSQDHSISVIDTLNYDAANIVIPKSYSNNLAGLAVSPDGSNIVVSDVASGSILVIDMSTYNVLYTVSTDQFPQYPVYLPDASQIFVPCVLAGTVTVIKQIQPD